MPSPQNSSLPLSFSKYPYSVWRSYAKSYNEYMSLLKIFRGVPQSWIEWTEQRVIQAEKRGVTIKNPLEYRTTVLWNGIISLQECKFLCDILENAFRQSVIEYLSEWKITYEEMKIANWNKFKQRFEDSPSTRVAESLIMNMTLGELTETMLQNWTMLNQAKNKPGFNMIFINEPNCQIERLFRIDMAQLRKIRNQIAHTNKLLFVSQSQKVYDRVNFWLTPLSVDLKQKVLSYRDKRPMFLQDLVMH